MDIDNLDDYLNNKNSNIIQLENKLNKVDVISAKNFIDTKKLSNYSLVNDEFDELDK